MGSRRGLGPRLLVILLAAASSATSGCGCGAEQPVDETVYITEAQFERLSAKTGTWDCMDLCALQNTGFDNLTSCEVGSAESAVGINDTGSRTPRGPTRAGRASSGS